MDDALESISALKVWVVGVLVIGILDNWKLAGGSNEHAGRKLVDHASGFISIDCGVATDYVDENTGIFYQSDTNFIDTGTNNDVSPEYYYSDPVYAQQAYTLRSFPQGTKNCYTLKPEQGKNCNYLIRAFFRYGNYDKKNQTPTFDVYVGVNHWLTVELDGASHLMYPDFIYVPSSDTILVCLINTGSGILFISALELRPLSKSMYPIDSGAQFSSWRYDLGTLSDGEFVRYKEDVYDRLWYIYGTLNYNSVRINTSSDIDVQDSNDGYKLPAQVLRTAVQASGAYNNTLSYPFPGISHRRWYVCFHFAEIAELTQGKKREFIISVNRGDYTSKPITLEYLTPLSICPNRTFESPFHFSIDATMESDLPPILNAFELYSVAPLLSKPTDHGDVTAIMEIKQTSRISREDWQGDPCSPNKYSWSGLTCSSDYTPRIISLNLSSSQLTGEIPISLSNLTALLYLDLSYNQLTGNIPQFLAQLPNLKTLNLSRNKFDGSIPEALIQKSRDGSLILSLGEMSDLDKPTNSRDGDQPAMWDGNTDVRTNRWRANKWWIWIIVAVVGIIIAFLCLLCYAKVKKHIAEGYRKKKQKILLQELRGNAISSTVHDKVKKRNNDRQDIHELQIFSFETISAATRNFSTENKLGEGGFGPVYKGELYDGQKIAIKRLSRSSGQGLVEFKNEAILIAKLQHTNLVKLLGLCIQQEEKILIYEYMPNKSLDVFLFDSTKKSLLNWKKRFNIIEGITQGLLYLHKYSRLRVIHRDLKASNILLDEDMNPKISDFGLARIFGLKGLEENTNRIVGT
ncbi:putative leucine-rich repeat receptor-like protein kinase At2g19210 isoform X2 [Quercus suber]